VKLRRLFTAHAQAGEDQGRVSRGGGTGVYPGQGPDPTVTGVWGKITKTRQDQKAMVRRQGGGVGQRGKERWKGRPGSRGKRGWSGLGGGHAQKRGKRVITAGPGILRRWGEEQKKVPPGGRVPGQRQPQPIPRAPERRGGPREDVNME